ncbi:cysteine hydrolase family protein [Rhizobium sp. 11515TR]|uniref:cysteine hydrolase family protein n=1 Tax=unclassified Rhizobium TaxID=2613769 RepID=UPI000BA83822|nr:cysteine hydrolase [Rhizobium sp. 11515TR]ASW10398.1 isochorismatase [Rhizobium sp. 11515TR]
MADNFPGVAAAPYSWPFDGQWSAADSALLILGFQNGTIAALCAEPEAAVAAKLIACARDAGLPVIASRRGRSEALSPVAARRAAMGDPVFAPGTSEWQLSDTLGLQVEASIFDHPGDNAFHSTGLEAWLRRRGIRNLVLAGVPTEGLLHATQRAANDMGFECITVSDACKGTTDARHAGQLRITVFGNGLFGTVARSDQLFSALRAPIPT